MKIGAFASLFAPAVKPQVVADLAQRLDSAGLDSLWFGEHVMLFDDMEFPYPGSADGKLPVPAGQGAPDQAAVIAYAASQTKQLRFGTGISLISQRNPIYTAKEFATLDWLTDGRIDLGVGVGWCKEEVLACGYAWDNRGARCNEALELMIKLWTEPTTAHTGRFFQVPAGRMDPKPVQRPHLPLIIGGYSQAAMQRTARYGQGWLGFGLPPNACAQLLRQLDAALENEGRTRADLDIIVMPADDSVATASSFAELGVNRLVPMISLADASAVEQRVQHLESLAQRFSS